MSGARLGEILKCIERRVPLELAEEWDRSGLQVGDPQQAVSRILVALDPTRAAAEEAAANKADLLITHHPLFLVPLKSLDAGNPQAALAISLIKHGIALYSSHTNFDRVDGGVNDALATRLGLASLKPLLGGEDAIKVVVTIPEDRADALVSAMSAAGGGSIGGYERCAFVSGGVGTFTAREGAKPFIGRVGEAEKVAEARIEMTVAASRLGAVLLAARGAHPYEEPVIDVYRMAVKSSTGALGRVGALAEETTLSAFAHHVATALDARALRVVGDGGRRVRRVAVCGGSGASLWRAAQKAGADVLVTGDVKHHDAVDALEAGFALIDAGHAATERAALPALAEYARNAANEAGVEVEVSIYYEQEPIGINI